MKSKFIEMLLFLILEDITFPPNNCTFKSNGAQGVLKYFKESEHRYNVSSYYLTADKNTWTTISGSFCPKSSGTYTLVASSVNKVACSFNFEKPYVSKVVLFVMHYMIIKIWT